MTSTTNNLHLPENMQIKDRKKRGRPRISEGGADVRSDSIQVHESAEEDRGNEIENVVVRNRDIPLLADVFPIMQEIRALEQRRLWQRERMTSLSQRLTGMPGRSGTPKGLDDAFAQLSEIDEEHERRCRDYVRQMKSAQRILNGIKSESMRAFVLMRYVMNLSNREIMRELCMTEWRFNQSRRSIENAENMACVIWRERFITGDVKQTLNT